MKINNNIHVTKTGILKRNPILSYWTPEDQRFIDHINKYAMVPINLEVANLKWLKEQLNVHRSNIIWSFLDNTRDGAKYFKPDPMEPEEGIFFVETEFLLGKKGNIITPQGPKATSIREGIKNKVIFHTPQYFLRDDNVGEGNHRVLVMYEMGVKSIPVRIYWKQ